MAVAELVVVKTKVSTYVQREYKGPLQIGPLHVAVVRGALAVE